MSPNLKTANITDDFWDSLSAERFASQLSEAIRNGGCPHCGSAVGVIHTEANGGKFRQCGYCGNRYPLAAEPTESGSAGTAEPKIESIP